MDATDVPYALECASNVSGLPWDGSQPTVIFLNRDYLGTVGNNVDRNGDIVAHTKRRTGAYFFGSDRAYMSQMADKPVLAHEMTHYLQDKAGMKPGAASAAAGVLLSQKRKIEAQGYNTERNAPYECETLLGRWKQDLMDAATAKIKAYELQSKKAKE